MVTLQRWTTYDDDRDGNVVIFLEYAPTPEETAKHLHRRKPVVYADYIVLIPKLEYNVKRMIEKNTGIDRS
jgi:hypothetical protein